MLAVQRARPEHSNARSTAHTINQLSVRVGLARWRFATVQTQPRSSPNAESELQPCVAEQRRQMGVAIVNAEAIDCDCECQRWTCSIRANGQRGWKRNSRRASCSCDSMPARTTAAEVRLAGGPHSIGQSAPAAQMQRKCSSTHLEQKRAAPPSAEVLFSPARCMKFRSGQSVNTLHSSLYAQPNPRIQGAKATTQQQQRFRYMAAGRHGCTALHCTALSAELQIIIGDRRCSSLFELR